MVSGEKPGMDIGSDFARGTVMCSRQRYVTAQVDKSLKRTISPLLGVGTCCSQPGLQGVGSVRREKDVNNDREQGFGLVGTILGMVVMAVIFIAVEHYQDQSYTQVAYQTAVQQTAQQQVQFSSAVNSYVAANAPTLSVGTAITASTLIQQGYLPQGFPLTNPLGQQPVAYVGS